MTETFSSPTDVQMALQFSWSISNVYLVPSGLEPGYLALALGCREGPIQLRPCHTRVPHRPTHEKRMTCDKAIGNHLPTIFQRCQRNFVRTANVSST